MSFAQGMQIGAQLWANAGRQKIAEAEDARAQDAHDMQMQAARESRAIMDEELARQAGTPADARVRAMPDFNEGPPTASQQDAYTPNFRGPQRALPNFSEGPPTASQQEAYTPDFERAPPEPPARTAQDIVATQNRLGMRLAAANRDTKGFLEATNAQASGERGRYYAKIGDLAEAGDPRLLAEVNRKNPNTTIARTKDGYAMMVVGDDGEATQYNLTKNDMRKLAIGNAMVQDGDLAGGMALIDGVNKDLAAVLKAQFERQLDATKANNQALHYSNADQTQRAQLAFNYANMREGARRFDVTQDNARLQGLQPMVNASGDTVMVGVRPDGQGGVETFQVNMPSGFRPPGRGAAQPEKFGQDGDPVRLDDGSVGVWREGERLARGAPAPSARIAHLKKMEIKEALSDMYGREGLLKWVTSGPTAGTEIAFEGKAYDVRVPGDINALNKAMEKRASLNQALHEGTLFMPKTNAIARKYWEERRRYEQHGMMDHALREEQADGHFAQFAKAIYAQESGSGANPKTSNAGAVGGMQILPSTFAAVADKDWDIHNPLQNVRAGIRYARQAWNAAGGNPVLAGAYYYGGPGGMAKAQQGIAVSDPRNPNAPDTLGYGRQIAYRMRVMRGAPVAALQLPSETQR